MPRFGHDWHRSRLERDLHWLNKRGRVVSQLATKVVAVLFEQPFEAVWILTTLLRRFSDHFGEFCLDFLFLVQAELRLWDVIMYGIQD